MLGLLLDALRGLLWVPLLSARWLGLALTRWRFVRHGAACGGMGRLLALTGRLSDFRSESPRFRVSALVPSLLPLHLGELRGVTAISWLRVAISTASLGLLLILVFRWLLTHSLEPPRSLSGFVALFGSKYSLPTSIILLAF